MSNILPIVHILQLRCGHGPWMAIPSLRTICTRVHGSACGGTWICWKVLAEFGNRLVEDRGNPFERLPVAWWETVDVDIRFRLLRPGHVREFCFNESEGSFVRTTLFLRVRKGDEKVLEGSGGHGFVHHNARACETDPCGEALSGLRRRSWPRWPEIAHARNGGDGIATQRYASWKGQTRMQPPFLPFITINSDGRSLRWRGHPHRFP